MKKSLLSIAMLLSVCIGTLSAQHRYLDEVFTSFTVTPIIYDTNIWVPPFSGTSSLGPRPQVGAVYMPAGDTLAARPVIIYLHTGSFLPAITNQQTTGNTNDSAVVEMCRRFAKRGFIAVAINYRLGWNPATTDPNVATGQLLNATYRSLQDAKNAIRFVRKNAMMFNADTSRIILGGQGTGGYSVLAAATVNKYSDITLSKFINSNTQQPHVDTSLSGDWHGLGGSIMNIPGDASISDKFHFTFNLGGAMGDSIWLEPGDVPMVAFHCLNDPFAPYGKGNVIVPTTGTVVISNASGSKVVIDKANRIGNNDMINAKIYDDVWTKQAMISSDGSANLYTFRFGQFPLQGSPWEWWDRAAIQGMGQAGITADSLSMLTNPDMSEAKAKAYIDTIQGFLVPRIVVALNLPGKELFGNTGIKELASLTSQLSVYPNPVKEELNIELPVTIKSVSIIDMMGREVLTAEAKSMQTKVNVSTLTPGLYFVNVKAADGRSAVKRVVVN
jgi:hypothetical protein